MMMAPTTILVLGVLVATFLGRAVHARMDAQAYVRYMHFGLLIVAAVLLVQSLR
jgi:uncharacterized membrane protein YfcA